MIRFRRSRQVSSMQKWLVGLILSVLIVPAATLYAMPGEQSVDNATPPCHQQQDNEQSSSLDNSSNNCCDTLHQCNSSCDHDCSDCFSAGHLYGLIILPEESPLFTNSHVIPVSPYPDSLISNLLLRPPCQYV